MANRDRRLRPLRIGLTGGIGSGKSTAARCFARLGIPVIDTDAIAAGLAAPGQEGLKRITELFGSGILNREGALDRARLRARVFAVPSERRALEQALHPLIRSEMRRRIGQIDAPYCILEIPLLLESGWESEVDRILVVDAPPDLQIEHAMQSKDIDREEVERIVAVQMDRDQRLAAADDIIRNDDGMDRLKSQVEQMHRFYLKKSQEAPEQ